MKSLEFYFDVVSPFAYFALHRLDELPQDVSISYRPVLLAGILGHWQSKGPAEIPPKRTWTYRWSTWVAAELGVPYRMPASHPFNPLGYLRLCLAVGNTPAAIRRIFEVIWTTGVDPQAEEVLRALAEELGVDVETLNDPAVKAQLRDNTEQAIAQGVFGVPSLVANGEIFWGADAIPMAIAYLRNPTLLDNDEIRRLDNLPVGISRLTNE